MTLQDLKNAVTKLSSDDQARFRAWFAVYDAEAWDRQIEEDARNDKLDALADKALRAHRPGESMNL
jgi:hypothetical protein